MKKHITITLSIFILIITGIVLLFLIQKNNQSITNKSDTLEYFESKKELNPSSTKALFFRSEQDISNKSPFELCYNSDSMIDGDQIFVGREQLSHSFQFMPMLENVQTGETKLIKSIGYQQNNDGCIHIAKWLDDTHLAQEGEGTQYEAFHSIDVDKDTIERIFESKTQYDQTQYGIGDYLFTQNCDNNQCEEILIFNDPKGKPLSGFCDRVSELCMQRGLLVVHTGRESIKLAPPLMITREALKEGIGVLQSAINDTIIES